MVSPIDEDYKLTKLIKQRKAAINAEFKPMADWIDGTYGVRTMNMIYGSIGNDLRPRLNIIFETDTDCDLFRIPSDLENTKQHEIASKFKQFVHDKALLAYNVSGLFIIFSSFEEVSKIEAYWSVSKDDLDKLRLELNIGDIWVIHRNMFVPPSVFFYTAAQLSEYSKIEIKNAITKKCFEMIKKYDEFNYFKIEQFDVEFDSKENFENYYKGNWFNYDRR